MFTSVLGTSYSTLASIVLGQSGLSTVQLVASIVGFAQLASVSVERSVSVSHAFLFQQEVRNGPIVTRTVSDTVAFNHAVSVVRSTSMAFTGILGTADSMLGDIVLGIATTGGGGSDPLTQDVSQILSFSQTVAQNTVRLIGVNQTLALAQTSDSGATYNESISDTLSLSDGATAQIDVPVSVSDTLNLVQTVTNNIKMVSVNQSLSLSQSATQRGPIYLTINHNLHLAQSEDGHLGTVNQTVADELVLVNKVGLSYEVSVSQSLALTQEGARKNIITDALALTQSVSVGKGGDVDQLLLLVQTLTTQSEFTRPISHSLGINQSVTYYVESPCITKSYSPYVGSTTDANYTAPSTTAPTIGHNTLTLTYPYTSPTTTLTLRNPSFGDKDRLTYTRINRMTRGGTLIVYSDTKWPKLQTLAVQVDNLSPKQASDLISFLRTSLGKEIGLLDWENRQWRGIVTTPDAQVTNTSKNDLSVSFQFQGMLA